jgi:hypothetical protein
MEANAETYLAVKCCDTMAGRIPKMRLEILSNNPPADYFDVGTLFVASEHLKAVLDEFKVHAEFLPLHIIYDGKEYTERNFYFCNILDCVECLDFTRGKYTFWKKPGFTDEVDKIKNLAIDEKKASGHNLFRIAKGAEYIVCASDRLAGRIEDLKFTGMRFVEPKDWRFGM